jgi:hypothetical protein
MEFGDTAEGKSALRPGASALQLPNLLAACDEITLFPFFHFGHFQLFEFVSDFGFRISNFRLRRAASFASLRWTRFGLWPLLLASFSLLAPTASAEKAPRSAEELVKVSDLVVVGQVTGLKISQERSHVERGFGNYDWAIDLTIKISALEKGSLASSNAVVARCFRLKSRKSITEYVSVSGNHPIPGVGTTVRAHLYREGGSWRVVFPNGLAPVSDQTVLNDAVAVAQLRSGSYTFLLPMELWILIAVVLGVGMIVVFVIKGIANLLHRKNQTRLD